MVNVRRIEGRARLGVLVAVIAAHAAALAAMLVYAPTRRALADAVPLFVRLVTPEPPPSVAPPPKLPARPIDGERWNELKSLVRCAPWARAEKSRWSWLDCAGLCAWLHPPLFHCCQDPVSDRR